MNKTQNATDHIVDYLCALYGSKMPQHVERKAKQCLLDYFGVAFAGAYINKEKMKKLFIPGEGTCTLIGLDCMNNGRTAAFINAFNAHTAELDDGSRFGMIHLGASIISASFAAMEENSRSYDQLIKGIVLGYETAVRVSAAMQPSHKKKGFHTSGTCGTLGAAVAAAFTMGCNREQLKATLSAAATSAAGLLEIQEDASTLKPYNLGNAAMAGLNAAYTGMAGFTGPEDILGGSRGFMRLLCDSFDFERLTQSADYYEIERVYVKPYAACRHCHSAIEATLKLRDMYSVPAEKIDKIVVRTYELAIRGHDHKALKGIASAKLSLPFSVAVSYIFGECGLDVYNEEILNNQDVADLIKKIEIIADEKMSKEVKTKRAAQVLIFSGDKEYSYEVEYAKGDPENPLSEYELIEKFEALMKWSGSNDKSKALIKRVLG